MKFTGIFAMIFALFFISNNAIAQQSEVKISKLVLDKKQKKIFNNRDSSIVLFIDTLVMKDKSSMQFYGKKDVKLVISHAEIGNNVYINGRAGKNNASNFDMDINFQKLGSLYVIARGQDANNGMKTDPNGDAGNINLTYSSKGIAPQTKDKKAKNYLHTDVTPGGLKVTPSSDLRRIYDQISMSASGLHGVPQGQIYSGSPGKEGKVTINSN